MYISKNFIGGKTRSPRRRITAALARPVAIDANANHQSQAIAARWAVARGAVVALILISPLNVRRHL
jgi:hypothetical protein